VLIERFAADAEVLKVSGARIGREGEEKRTPFFIPEKGSDGILPHIRTHRACRKIVGLKKCLGVRVGRIADVPTLPIADAHNLRRDKCTGR
jgi:hypothetical protein